MNRKTCLAAALAFIAIVVVAGAVLAAPMLPVQVNPPVVKEPTWDSPQTRALAQRACFDCHSNETVWPWYSRSLAASWLVTMDVREGRRRLNFSDWGANRQGEGGGGERENHDLGESVLEGEMPPFQYLLMHPEARLTASEKEQLASGLRNLR